MSEKISMEASNCTVTSAPLKKRDIEVTRDMDEHAAAAALSSLHQISTSASHSDGNASDTESTTSEGSTVIPKKVHKPPLISTMVDHTYTDYSVVDEELLDFLRTEDDLENEVKASGEDQANKDKKLKKIAKIFGDISLIKKNSGGVVQPFPEKLMEVLDREDMTEIITWLPHGRAFIVKDAQQLKEIVLPRFFKQSKFMSFTRQLNLWGYKRITKHRDAGAYYHELFLRGRPNLTMFMRRQKIKGIGIKLTPNPETEPNFYKISESRPLPAKPPRKDLAPLPPINRECAKQRMLQKFNDERKYRNTMNFLQQSPHLHPQMMHGMMSSPMQQRMQYQGAYNMDMAQTDVQRPFQRLSAPVTQTDFSMLQNSLQSRSMEQHAILNAQQLLQQVSSQQRLSQNPVEDLKRKLLNAVHSLEQSQAAHTHDRRYSNPGNVMGSINQYGINQRGMQSMSTNRYQTMSPQQNPYMNMQQQNMFAQSQEMNLPPCTDMNALMSALDQTRQVAAAAHAQSNLLQKVANDIAMHKQSNRHHR